MATLKKAHNELFKRGPDESFASFHDLHRHCLQQQQSSNDFWERPQDVTLTHDLTICNSDGDEQRLNNWSFSQLCRMASVSKDTINRLSPKTASKALNETLPQATDKPLQILSADGVVRSVHGVAYTRLWNTELLNVVTEFASEFTPPQTATDGQSSGLYCGEQDMFAFMIDPAGWVEIDGEGFAPGFFIWNSEVGRRSVGIQTFWFQRICQNHIVWDATDIIEFSRKHTANVRDALNKIRSIVEALLAKRDQRRDSFASVIQKAMTERLGSDADEVAKALCAERIPRSLVNDALEIARKRGSFTIFSLVDALTKLSQKVNYAGDRAELDARIGQLLALAV